MIAFVLTLVLLFENVLRISKVNKDETGGIMMIKLLSKAFVQIFIGQYFKFTTFTILIQS